MLRKTMLSALALTGVMLGACNHQSGQARLENLPEPAPTTTSLQVLAFTDDGANAKLASMDAGLGGPGVMLECEHGARLVHVTRVGDATNPASLVLSSDGRRSTLAAQPEVFEGRRLMTAQAPLDADALRGFRRSATVRVEDGAHSLTATTEDGRDGAERFFAACEGRA